MNNENTSLYEALKRHQSFNEKYPTEIAAVKGYDLEKKKMDDNVTIAETSMKLLHKEGVTDSETVETKKMDMSVFLADKLEGCTILAEQANLPFLAKQLKKSFSYFFGASKVECINRANQIRTLMFKNKTILNLSDENIVEIDAYISGYNDIKDLPVEQKQEKKSLGNDNLTLSLNVGRKASVKQYKLFHSFYKNTKADIVDELKQAHTPIETGKKFTPLTISIIDAVTGLAITGASVSKKVKRGVKTILADKAGTIPFKTHKAGKTTYTVVAPNYETTTAIVKVKFHAENQFEVKLNPIENK